MGWFLQNYPNIKIKAAELTIFCPICAIFSAKTGDKSEEYLAIKTPAVAKITVGDNQIYKMEKCLVGNFLEEIGQVIVQFKGAVVLHFEIILAFVSQDSGSVNQIVEKVVVVIL